MANEFRKSGIFDFSNNLEVVTDQPLDARHLVKGKEGLTNIDTWKGSQGTWVYPGMFTGVYDVDTPANTGIYVYVGPTRTEAEITKETNWKKVLFDSEGSLTTYDGAAGEIRDAVLVDIQAAVQNVSTFSRLMIDNVANLPELTVDNIATFEKTIAFVQNDAVDPVTGNNYYDEYMAFSITGVDPVTYAWFPIGNTKFDIDNIITRLETLESAAADIVSADETVVVTTTAGQTDLSVDTDKLDSTILQSIEGSAIQNNIGSISSDYVFTDKSLSQIVYDMLVTESWPISTPRISSNYTNVLDLSVSKTATLNYSATLPHSSSSVTSVSWNINKNETGSQTITTQSVPLDFTADSSCSETTVSLTAEFAPVTVNSNLNNPKEFTFDSVNSNFPTFYALYPMYETGTTPSVEDKRAVATPTGGNYYEFELAGNDSGGDKYVLIPTDYITMFGTRNQFEVRSLNTLSGNYEPAKAETFLIEENAIPTDASVTGVEYTKITMLGNSGSVQIQIWL